MVQTKHQDAIYIWVFLVNSVNGGQVTWGLQIISKMKINTKIILTF